MSHNYIVLIRTYHVNKYIREAWLDWLLLGVLVHCPNWLDILFLSITQAVNSTEDLLR